MKEIDAITFGVMYNGAGFSPWQVETMQKLLNVQGVRAGLLIVDESEIMLKKADEQCFLLRLMNRFAGFGSTTVSSADGPMRLSDLPKIIVQPADDGVYSKDDIEAISGFNLDFILKFTSNPIGGEILNVTPCGVWVFQHGDDEKDETSIPGFWEVHDGDPVSVAVLQRLSDGAGGTILLQKGFFKTDSRSYSLNRDKLQGLSTDWPARVCKDILNGKAGYLNVDGVAAATSRPICRLPNNWQMAGYLYKIICNRVKSIIESAFYLENWNVGVINKPIKDFVNNKEELDIQWLAPTPPGHFRADPFAICHNEQILLMVEDYNYSVGKGRVSAAAINPAGLNCVDIAWHYDILDLPVHLSYPYIFSHEGEIYCVPETHELKKVMLYKMVEMPAKWAEQAVLIENFAAIDSTVFFYGSLWWLFCTDADTDSCSKLYAWYADDITGPWLPHKANPIKSDVRSSRPAGTPFLGNGQLYRPAQDCSLTYGGRIVINRIVTLTTTEFCEEQVNVVEPVKNSPYRDGLHTVCQLGSCTIVDSKKEEFALLKPWYMLLRTLASVKKEGITDAFFDQNK